MRSHPALSPGRAGLDVFAPVEPAEDRDRSGGAGELRGDDRGDVVGADAGESVAERARQRDRGIGEGGRGGEPIGGGDVGRHRARERRGEATPPTLDERDQAETRGELAGPLPEAAALARGDFDDRQIEHEMRQPHADNRADDLRARDRREGEDERDQGAARRQRIGEEGEGEIAAGEPLRHDAGADNGGEQQRRADALGCGAPSDAHIYGDGAARPISSALRLRASRSSLSSGSTTKSLMRASSRRYASRKAAIRCSSVPAAAAGSGTPQCAVTGLPGHTGQVSPAAWSQTVKTKSMTGASARANSSQDLLRACGSGMRSLSSSWSVSGCTSPLGKEPALWPRKRPRPQWLISASARMLRAELPVHRKRTS